MTIGSEIIRLVSVGSTMDVIDEYARAGALEGLTVVADEQKSGRGRAGRVWSAAPGSSLLCSLLLRPSISPDRLGPLPLVVGVAVAETIESFIPVTCGLKWPNDVLIAGRKVAGILMQSRLSGNRIDFLNIGIGINVHASHAELPDGAISMQVAGGDADRDDVLATLLDRLKYVYRNYIDSGGRPDLSEWKRRATLLGENVSIRHGADEVIGQFVGVDGDGRMLLELDSGERRAFSQGEISRGPRKSN
jgi:BirA family biotin operon repressor/biotin-[acetyl-CoA-carboxylase] ligase